MEGVVPIQERKRRNKMLRILSEKKKRAFYKTQIGKKRPILFENENREGYMYGYTDNYFRVKTFWNPELANKTKTFRISGICNEGFAILEEQSRTANATDFSRI